MTTENDDEGAFTIKCSNCMAPLVDVWKKNKESEQFSSIRASCGHCGDRSFIREQEGEFYIGGTDYTSIESVNTLESEEENSKVLRQKIFIHTLKVKEYG